MKGNGLQKLILQKTVLVKAIAIMKTMGKPLKERRNKMSCAKMKKKWIL